MTTTNNQIEMVGGIEKAREIVSKAPSNAESYQGGYYFRELPQFMFHNGFHDQWNLTDNDGLYFKAAGFHPVRIDDLRTAIAEHDNRAFKEGDWVVKIRGNDHRLYVFPIQNIANPKCCYIDEAYKNRSEYISIINIRHASPSEIKAGHRIDDTDHVTDIRNHVSPNCKVMERNNESE